MKHFVTYRAELYPDSVKYKNCLNNNEKRALKNFDEKPGYTYFKNT